jgi:hypothetical protein
VGLDRLIRAATLWAAFLLLATAGCDHEARPKHLLNGQAAAEFRPVEGSVVTQVRVVRAAFLARRFSLCVNAADRLRFPVDTVVVERVGVFSESLTFRDRSGQHLYSCDGGTDRAGERQGPWCGRSVGRLYDGSLLDPRLDILCADLEGRPLAYAWVEPAAGSHWIGVDQGSYVELYEVEGEVPVRIATRRGIDRAASRATFEVVQYDIGGRELVSGTLEAAVAG